MTSAPPQLGKSFYDDIKPLPADSRGEARFEIALSVQRRALVETSSGWLRAEVPLTDRVVPDKRQMLALNRDMPGGVKLCLNTQSGACLRVEMPQEGTRRLDWAEYCDIHPRDACDDRTALALCCLRRAIQFLEAPGVSTQPTEQDEANLSVPNIAALCDGWKCIERASGRWMVALDVPSAFIQAELTLCGDELRMRVALNEWGDIPQDCSRAIIDMLVRACAALRLCRAAIEPTRSNTTRALLLANVRLADLETDIIPALSALSIGARCLHRELNSLQNTNIAGFYLAMTSSQSGRDHTNNEGERG